MSRFWSPEVVGLTPYVAGEQPNVPGVLKMNTNENPYGPAPEVLATLAASATDDLRLYPDPASTQLRECIATYHNLRPDHVFVGNGSDEVLAHTFVALLRHRLPILFPDVSYSFYRVYCQLFGIKFIEIPVNKAFEIDVADYTGLCGGIIMPNPNAPTGIALALYDIESLLERHPDSVLVVDEAYVDFGAQSAVELIARQPNLLVIRTLSKSRSLAGLRVGYALGSPELIAGLDRVKASFNSYPVDRLAARGAMASFAAESYFRRTCDRIIATRGQLITDLQQLGFKVLPSSANFIFATHAEHDAVTLAQGLRLQSILVRHFALPRIDRFIRIAVGTDDDCSRLVAAIRSVMCGAIPSSGTVVSDQP